MADPTVQHSTDLSALAGRTFDAVLFDMDGTLIDSMGGSLRAWHAWAAEHEVDPAALADLGGRPAAQVIPALLTAERVADALARIEHLEIEAAADGIEVLPGTVEALALPAGCRAAFDAQPHVMNREAADALAWEWDHARAQLSPVLRESLDAALARPPAALEQGRHAFAAARAALGGKTASLA